MSVRAYNEQPPLYPSWRGSLGSLIGPSQTAHIEVTSMQKLGYRPKIIVDMIIISLIGYPFTFPLIFIAKHLRGVE